MLAAGGAPIIPIQEKNQPKEIIPDQLVSFLFRISLRELERL
jgi:hypothetical protein